MKKSQVVVLGGGPGGYAAAFMAADLGLETTLVDDGPNPGGVCLFRGCIPSKALLHAAKVLTEAREAEKFGIHFASPSIDLDKLRGWKSSVVSSLTGGLGQLAKQRKVDFVQGRGKLTGPHSLQVGAETIEFEHLILASGSRPIIPGPLAIESERVLDSTGALELKDIPKKLLVVGGGYIGLELGTVYQSLGSEVTVVEMLPTLLPNADRDLVRVLAKRVEAIMKVLLKTRVASLKDTGKAVEVELEDEQGKRSETFDRVLISVGRRPNSENLGLETTRVQVNARGFVEIDNTGRTAEPSIYAIGDVAGDPMLAHKASHQGRVAAQAIAGQKVAFEPLAIPAVVFTDPELAWAGLTEAEAKEQGLGVKIARYPWAASGRALTLGRPEGLTKLVLSDDEEERVLGVGIVGAGAGELLAEGVLAMEMGAVAEDLALSIHAHPTLSETVMESAEVLSGTSTHVYKPARAARG